jgi:hypothetical protein
MNGDLVISKLWFIRNDIIRTNELSKVTIYLGGKSRELASCDAPVCISPNANGRHHLASSYDVESHFNTCNDSTLHFLARLASERLDKRNSHYECILQQKERDDLVLDASTHGQPRRNE